MDSQTPTSRKGVQQPTGCLVALGGFISCFTYRLKSLFTTLKGAKQAGWNQECDQALIAMKKYLTKPPVLVSPEVKDTLFIYLAVPEILVSAALFKEDENQKQRPIFFVSKSLFEAETRYTRLEQAALALRVAAKKLRPYFEAHPIIILTNLPLRSTMHKPDLSSKWLGGQLS